jgi:hypothetical protein
MKKHSLTLLVVLSVAGCQSDDANKRTGLQSPSDEITVELGDRPSQTLDLDSFEMEWDEIDVRDDGEHDPFQVAKWVKQRRAGSRRCLSAHPPDHKQAVRLLSEILRHVPNSSDRGVLAQVTFANAAHWFRRADALGYEVERIEVEKTVRPGGRPLTEDDVGALLVAYAPYIEDANSKCRVAADESLRQWEHYQKARPDDRRRAATYIWRLYFYRQDYRAALTWLDFVLKDFDLSEVPETEPLRVTYVEIRKVIVEYLAKLRLSGREPGRGIRGLLESDGLLGGDR